VTGVFVRNQGSLNKKNEGAPSTQENGRPKTARKLPYSGVQREKAQCLLEKLDFKKKKGG